MNGRFALISGIWSRRTSPWAVFVLMVLGTSMPLVDTTIMNVGRYYVVRAFDITTYETGWLTAGYSLAFALGIPLSHRLRGFFEERSLYAIATGTFIVGTGVVISSHTLAEAMIGRAIQGISGGILLPLSTALIRESFPSGNLRLALSLFSLINVIAVSLGPTIGGYLIYAWGWKSAFFLNFPIGFLTAILSQIILINHPRQDPKRFDLVGFMLLCLTTGISFYAFMAAEWFGWHSFPIDLSFGISFGAFFLYGLWDALFSDPILPLKLLLKPRFLVVLILIFLISTSVFGRMYLLAPFLERNYHFQPYQAGEIIAIGAVSEILIAFLIFSDIIGRVDSRAILVLGCGCLALSNLSYLRLPQNEYSAQMTTIPQLLFGFGVAFSQFSFGRLVAQSLPSDLGRIGGVYQQTVQFLGGMFGTMLCRHLLNNIPPVFFLSLSQTSSPPPVNVDLQNIASLAYAFGYNMIFEWMGFLPAVGIVVLAGWYFSDFFLSKIMALSQRGKAK